MPEPEDSMNAACQALLAGDIFTAMGYLTPEAITEAMSMSTGVAALPTPTGFSIESQEQQDGNLRYRVRFQTTQGDVLALASWRQVEGAWRITSLSIVPPS